MNTVVTSREEILQACRALVAQSGLAALNMRAVAQRCNVALGSIYNYFPSKNELMTAIIQSVWQDIFHMQRPCAPSRSFAEDVQRIFGNVLAGMQAYPDFFAAHSIGFARENRGQARETMGRYFLHMENGLLEALQRDDAVRADAFGDAFTQVAFVRFVLEAMVSQLMQRAPSCDVLLEMIRRSLY